MFCNYCGTSYPEDAHYCSACGRRNGHEAPAQRVPISPAQESPTGLESKIGPKGEPTKEELFRLIDEVEKNLERCVTGAPPPDLRRLAPESETSSMMSSIGPYTLGADIGSLQGLVELTFLEYLAMPKEFPGEKIFKGRPVDFLGREWEIVIGSIEGCVYKIQAQITSDDPTVVSEAITTTFRYCKERLGWPTKQKQVRLNTMNIWSMEEGNVVLGTGGGSGRFRFVNLALTSAVVVRSRSVAKKKGFLRRVLG